jgi:endogenous inhibitor of DNA gyrase (YacG/DUF329 family)
MVKARKGRGCPICGKAPKPESKPFCSSKCADIDLNRWLGGRYRIATDEKPANEPPPED